MRLIDADELMEKYHKTPVWDSWVEINNAPTIDAVPVVRCKDCKWFTMDNTGGTYCNHLTCGLFNGYEPDAFCSYGERKESNE